MVVTTGGRQILSSITTRGYRMNKSEFAKELGARAGLTGVQAQKVTDEFLALLTEDVAHDVSQGGREVGRDAFGRFMAHMDRCYRERITDLVVMVDATGTRAARRTSAKRSWRLLDGRFHGRPATVL
jgi:nucleoid DNA-binding protein